MARKAIITAGGEKMDNLAKIRAKLSGCIEGAGYNRAACGLYGLLTAKLRAVHDSGRVHVFISFYFLIHGTFGCFKTSMNLYVSHLQRLININKHWLISYAIIFFFYLKHAFPHIK